MFIDLFVCPEALTVPAFCILVCNDVTCNGSNTHFLVDFCFMQVNGKQMAQKSAKEQGDPISEPTYAASFVLFCTPPWEGMHFL